jgi:hypothetical protein
MYADTAEYRTQAVALVLRELFAGSPEFTTFARRFRFPVLWCGGCLEIHPA